jgi:phosphopantothenoylcysteine decarboxylase / phosphopantothenate---cysteine ligase
MRVVLGVGGGIAAYKAAELARALLDRGSEVQVVMTRSAGEFIRPLTFAALTGRKVITDLFNQSSDDATHSSSIEHIQVAVDHDVMVIAPATADLIAKLAHGLADDFLTTTYLAFKGPVIIAPAMNVNMWQHPATRENVRTLQGRGHTIVGPEEGELACGMTGPGRLADPQYIASVVLNQMSLRDLDGETVLVTAGPTQEPLDPVRYISNRSSGKMGYAIAEAAVQRGASVVLISGPVHLNPPAGVRLVKVKTAREMRDAVMAHLEASSMIVKSAAVADYHLSTVPAQKTKKTAARVSLELDPTPDILAEVGARKGGRLLIGFAAETERLAAEARRKLETKNCDMVVANLVNQEGTGFESDDNEVLLVLRTGENVHVPRAPKREVANRIFDHVLRLRRSAHTAA